MAYKNIMSNTEDVVWLAYQLKDKLGSKISINRFGLWKEVLEAKYNLKGYDRGLDFSILYCDKGFLRVEVGEIGAYRSTYEEKIFILNELKTAIGSIVRDGISLGSPSVFYNIRDDEYMIPHLEYIYDDKEETIKAFKDKTIFDDGIPEDVIIFDDIKGKDEFRITKGYTFLDIRSSNKYSIGIFCMLNNKSNIETTKIKKILIENLDDLFNGDNNLLEYQSDISYIIAYIKNALSLAEEKELAIIIKKDDDVVHFVGYIKGILTQYEHNCEYGECIMNTNYTTKSGIKFETKSDTSAYDLIDDVVRNELQTINALKDISNAYNVKSNQSLLKLVRRIDNK